MGRWKKSEITAAIKGEMNIFIKPFGFRYKPNYTGNISFIRDVESCRFHFSLSKELGYFVPSKMFIRFNTIEDVLSKSGILVQETESTIFDDNLKWPMGDFIDSHEQFVEQIEKYKNYLITHGIPFIEKYSNLQNVLIELDRLEAENKYWRALMCGTGEHFMRVLIISKLCNDVNYFKKLEKVENFYYDPQYELEEYQHSFTKLKKILEELK